MVGGIPHFGGVALKGHARDWCIVVDGSGLHDGRVGNGGEMSKQMKPPNRVMSGVVIPKIRWL